MCTQGYLLSSITDDVVFKSALGASPFLGAALATPGLVRPISAQSACKGCLGLHHLWSNYAWRGPSLPVLRTLQSSSFEFSLLRRTITPYAMSVGHTTWALAGTSTEEYSCSGTGAPIFWAPLLLLESEKEWLAPSQSLVGPWGLETSERNYTRDPDESWRRRWIEFSG